MGFCKFSRGGVAAIVASLVALVVWFAATPRAAAEGAEGPKFVGAPACRKCHLKEYRSWAATPMARTFDSLKPGERKEAKEKAKLDAAKDYTKEDRCLQCHVTGHGMPGGYPKAADADQALAADRQGIQCEMCHGPGSQYVVYMREHEKDYRTDEAKKLGLVAPDAGMCAGCHKGGPDGSPTMAGDAPFDGAARLKAENDTSIHAHFKKK